MNGRGTNTSQLYAEVAISLPIDTPLHYTIPGSLQPFCTLGKRVLVPLGKRRVTGYIIDVTTDPPRLEGRGFRDIVDVLDETPLFHKKTLEFLRWVSTHYMAPLGEVIKTALPPGINTESYCVVSLTSLGRDAASSTPDISAGHLSLLHAINPETGTPLRTLLKRFPRRSTILTLHQRGLITFDTKLKQGRTRMRTIVIVSLAIPDPSIIHATKKEHEFLRYLHDGPAPMSTLRLHFKGVPRLVKRLRARGLITVHHEEVYRHLSTNVLPREEIPPHLTDDQQLILSAVTDSLKTGVFQSFLLHGVTGSGKTEVYLRAAEETLSLGKSVMILVPEISLTPQLLGRFKKRLNVSLALLHSGLSPGERYDQWRKINRREAPVIVGARSAIFAPCHRLGLIVVDEEHDQSYKQEEGVKYHARDLAVVRGHKEKAVVVLGSATPSLESVYNSHQGKYHLLTLPHRIGGVPLPPVEIVDLRRENGRLISRPLRAALAENVQRGEQSLLFLNRRGFSSSVICTECGSPFTCPHCSVSLTLHAGGRTFICHYCGHRSPAPQLCAGCGGTGIKPLGAGTEKVEQEVRILFPGARIARMDSDVVNTPKASARLLAALDRREIDILVGTQMIVKGHDFPHITLMGIITADVTMNLPDFRAAERTYQLVSQAAGRVGRQQHPGRVIIQTFLPEHYVIQHAKLHNYRGFYDQEMAFRKTLGYPPVTRMISLRISSRNQEDGTRVVEALAKRATQIARTHTSQVQVMGPSPAPIPQIHGWHRWHLIVKGIHQRQVSNIARSLREVCQLPRGTKIVVDVDPVSLL